MGKYILPFLLFSFVWIAGCGPSTTARDTENQQENSYLHRQISQMKNIEGRWVGCMMKYGSGKKPSSSELSHILLKATTDQLMATRRMTIAVSALRRGRRHGQPSQPEPRDPIEVPPNPIPDMPPEDGPPLKGAPSCKGGEIVVLQIFVIDMLQADLTRNQIVEVPTLTGIFRLADSTAENANVVFTSGLYREQDQIVQLTSTTVFAANSAAIAPTILQMQMLGNQMSGRYIAPQIFADVTFNKVQ